MEKPRFGELFIELSTQVEELAERERFSGAVLLAEPNGGVGFTARGLACRNHVVEIDRRTRFNLASMNKMFTAVAIGRLMEQGALRLDQAMGEFLDSSWLADEGARAATIRQTLSHASGLGDYFNREFTRSSRELFREVDDYKPLIVLQPIKSAPGERFRYGNSGFMLLGAVIERVTGRRYFDVIREWVYQPAEMRDTDSFDLDGVVPNLATGYSRRDSPDGPFWESNLFKHVIRGGPAGGGISTAHDMFAFSRALREDRLVSRSTRELLWTVQPPATKYGLGFHIREVGSDRAIGHAGNFSGISTRLDMYEKSGVTLVVLCNLDNAAEPIAGLVEERHRALFG